MLSLEIPPAPGLTICSDYILLNDVDFVLFVDLFSNWIKIFSFEDKKTVDFKNVLRQYILCHGVPGLIHADQGPSYTSAEFDSFCNEWGIAIRTHSADYPQGNRTAEAAVK